MSRSLSIECDRVPEPSASDPLERQTWAALRIDAGQRCVTRVLDRATGDETDAIYIPLFPVADWIVRNLVDAAERGLPLGESPARG